MEREITVERTANTTPNRGWDFVATFKDEDAGDWELRSTAYGSTEQEAIDNLKQAQTEN
jgi:predicted RNase H-like HicB family nuclease